MPNRVRKQNSSATENNVLSRPRPKADSKLNILRGRHLSEYPWLVHGFSTRSNGFSRAYGGNALNLGFTKEDSKAAVERNRAVFLAELESASDHGRTARSSASTKSPGLSPLITLRQIHSDIIHFVDSPPESQLAGDGLITATPGLLLGIQAADCLPIMLVDAKQRAIGVFHAGWRGTLKRIVEKGVGEMHRRFRSRPRDLKAAIGPAVHGCCYEVGREVREKFESQFSYAAKLFREVEDRDPVRDKYPMLFLTARPPGHGVLPKKIFLDLVEANRQQLLSVGVLAKNIEASPLCTQCRPDLLFSYRAEKGKTGRMMGVVGIRA
ncbi:MAG: peptidoglycan editing factor PgeF [Candidatus Sulfotelmatobacter sp.]|nr:peptidoglycan editing factor PgeF [Candidatus Sulfotelmatobacter sp.]